MRQAQIETVRIGEPIAEESGAKVLTNIIIIIIPLPSRLPWTSDLLFRYGVFFVYILLL